jgi:hypothetical protein
MYGHVFAASGGAGPRPAAASQAACTGRAEGPPQRGALPHIILEYVAGFFETDYLGFRFDQPGLGLVPSAFHAGPLLKADR